VREAVVVEDPNGSGGAVGGGKSGGIFSLKGGTRA